LTGLNANARPGPISTLDAKQRTVSSRIRGG
jgi:hypothetical protein